MKFLQSFARWAAPYHGNICKIMRLCESILAGCSFLISACDHALSLYLCKISGHIYVLYKTKKQKQRVHGSTLFALYEAAFPFAASPSCGSPHFYDFQGPLTEATIVPHYNSEGEQE